MKPFEQPVLPTLDDPLGEYKLRNRLELCDAAIPYWEKPPANALEPEKNLEFFRIQKANIESALKQKQSHYENSNSRSRQGHDQKS